MKSVFETKISNFFSDERFSEILTGSVWSFLARVFSVALTFIITVMVTRVYGAESMGNFALVQSVMMFLSVISLMGTNVSVLRLIPEHISKYSVTSSFKIYRKIVVIVAISSLIVGGILEIISDVISDNLFRDSFCKLYFTLISFFLVCKTLMDFNIQAMRGLCLIKTFALMQLLHSVIMLLALIVFTIFDGGDNNPIYAQMVSWAVMAFASTWILHFAFVKRVRKTDVVQSMSFSGILSVSVPMLTTTLMVFIIGQTGIILLGIYRVEAEVGCYAVVVKLATLTTFILQAINTIIAPKFSELYHQENFEELFYVARKSTRMIFWATVPLLLILVMFGRPILGGIFGYEFIGSYHALVLLVLGQFVNSISGSTGNFMNMTGNQKVFRNIMMLTAFINVGISFVLIPSYGINGAAFASMVCLVFWNVCALVYINSKFGRSIGYFPFLELFLSKSKNNI